VVGLAWALPWSPGRPAVTLGTSPMPGRQRGAGVRGGELRSRPGDDYPAAVAMVMAQPEVAYLHVRSATAQCFTFEVRSA
jgi:Protein of unknown function (DUF1203)